jgi:hypothetical protein
LRERTQTEPGRSLRAKLSHFLKSPFATWRSSEFTAFGNGHQPGAGRSFYESGATGAQNVSSELGGIIAVLNAGRRKMLVNAFLHRWTGLWNWILVGLVLAAALIPNLRFAAILAAGLILIGSACIAAWTWWMRPSALNVACRLDSLAALQDRISTALYFGGSADSGGNSGGMIECQRRDALAKFRQLDATSLFPLRMPATARRTLALFLVVAALFTYRMYYRPPLIALLQRAAMSRLVASVLTPLERNLQESGQRPQSLPAENPDALNESRRPADSTQSPEDAFAPDKAELAPDNAQGPGSGDGGQDPSENPGGDSSTSKALLDALKALLGNQSSISGAKLQPRDAEDPQGNPNQGDPGDGGDKRDLQQDADSMQKNPQGTANGAGDQQAGPKDLKKTTPLTVKSVPDRVKLQTTNLKDQPLMNVSAEAGTAQIATGDASPQANAVVNGAEQESVPARYRAYVQRYFEHADNGKQ